MEINITPKLIGELSEGFIQVGELIAKQSEKIIKKIDSQKMCYSMQDINELEKISQEGINYIMESSVYIDLLKGLLEKIDPQDRYAEDKGKDLLMVLNYQSSLHQGINRLIVDNNSLLEDLVKLGNAINIRDDSLN